MTCIHCNTYPILISFFGQDSRPSFHPVRHGKTVRSGRVNLVAGQTGCGLKRVRVNRVVGSVFFTCFFFNYLFFIYKENNLYLSFGKSCNKLFDVECIILKLISRMNSVKLINIYSIILKLYKSQHC